MSYKLCGVILAAGASSRMGRDKALLPWPPTAGAAGASTGQTLLSAAIAALQSQCDAVMVVVGRNAAAVAHAISAGGAEMVVNPDPDRGQFSSLQTGLREAVSRGYNAAMITPVDCPPLAAGTLVRLRRAFDGAVAAGKWAVAPEHDGRHGHPLLAGRALIDAFLMAPATSNAREVKHAHEEAIETVSVPEPLLAVDLNTPEEYAALSVERAS